MTDLSRREFMYGIAATAAGTAIYGRAFAQTPKRGGTLRFIPMADLKVLDPIWTTTYTTRDHGYMIYDTLFATDANLQIRPQMVDSYTVSRDYMKYNFTLREGLRFHDGQAVTAEDCVLSLQRWGKKDPLGRFLLTATGKLQAVDKKTFVLELKEPFGLVLEALGKPSSNVPFIMPARLAATSENEQVKEPIGSGPYRFVKAEWRPGSEVVYERNPDYVPRNEPPSGAAGGKVVWLDRVVWRYIPDPSTASAALEAGEMDYWGWPPLDFVSRFEKNRNFSVVVTDPIGSQGWIRPNHLYPPFDSKKARQALLWMVDQKMFLQAAVGQSKYYRTCPSYFTCGGTPYETAAGAPARQDLGRAQQLMKEAGYDGRPVVLLDPTDISITHALALVTRELLTQIGVNVDLQAMDWMTLVARRAVKKPPKEGGWNIVNTRVISSDAISPDLNFGLTSNCDQAPFGWPCSEKMEKLRAEFVRATDVRRRKQLAEQVQVLAYEEIPYVPVGQWVSPVVFGKSVHGVLQFPSTLLWNIWLDR